jgi:protein O-mannosyl-transferase
VLHRRAPWVALGILWFFACHLLESTVLALELVFEHRNYLAILGLTLALLGGVGQLLRRVQLQRLAVPTFAAFVLLVGLNTAVRAADWSDMERLLASEHRRDPQSPRALMELTNLASAQGNQALAIQWLNHLLALDLPDASAELGALQVYCKSETVNNALYERALQKLQTGIVSPTTVAHLRHLVAQSLRGHCPVLAREQLILMTEYARTSPRVRAPSIACAGADVQLWLLIDAQDWPGANRVLRETVYKCAESSPITVQITLDNILGFGAFAGQDHAARAMLESLEADANLNKRLDRVYRAYGGFSSQAVIGKWRRADLAGQQQQGEE